MTAAPAAKEAAKETKKYKSSVMTDLIPLIEKHIGITPANHWRVLKLMNDVANLFVEAKKGVKP